MCNLEMGELPVSGYVLSLETVLDKNARHEQSKIMKGQEMFWFRLI